MDKLEKVIKALECCISPGHDCPKDCPYYGNCNRDELHRDALELLKMLEPIEPIFIAGQYECGECRYELRADADSYCPCCGITVDDAPTVDAVPVIRCKDCEYSYFADNRVPAEQNLVCERTGCDVTPDWFCAAGWCKKGDSQI